MTRRIVQSVRRFPERQAAPAGGARILMRVWGCLFGCFFLLLPVSASASDLPSGQSVTLLEVRQDELGAETWLRFRFVAPELGAAEAPITYGEAEADMAVLCRDVALPYMAEHQLKAGRIVISLSEKPIDFGVSDASVIQFFDGFRVENNRCIWEGL